MSTKFRALRAASIAILGVLLGQTSHAQAVAPQPFDCDRACLYGVVDQYLAALAAKDPWRLPWAKDAKFTENNVALKIGDGLWGTLSAVGSYKLKFADAATGQVGFFGNVQEAKTVSAFALRIKVDNRKISEVEQIIVRTADFGSLDGGPSRFAHPVFEDKPILQEDVAVAERRPRERMISIADGYFSTLQLNDGALFTQFDKDCNRVENGLPTTNNAKEVGRSAVAGLGCADQFKLGHYRFDDRLRGRRYSLIDEERGLVFASAFIDHSGKLGTYTYTDGRVVESPIRRPHSYYLMELFKIKDGKIRQVEAVFITVPYYMPSPWDK